MTSETGKILHFQKMQALGNDFILLDAPELAPSGALAARLADRKRGIGADQVVFFLPPGKEGGGEGVDVRVRMFNADASELEACGNATRCIARRFMDETGRTDCRIGTVAGSLECRRVSQDTIAVDMGAPGLNWSDIPLAREADTAALDLVDLPFPGLPPAVCVNMGNPHAVFFVGDVERDVPLAEWGPRIETHPLFPARTNVEFASVLPPGPDGETRIRMRVWERGTGITEACGSGACATLVAAVRTKQIANRRAIIAMDGGDLDIEWRAQDEHVLMTGSADYVFEGRIGL